MEPINGYQLLAQLQNLTQEQLFRPIAVTVMTDDGETISRYANGVHVDLNGEVGFDNDLHLNSDNPDSDEERAGEPMLVIGSEVPAFFA